MTATHTPGPWETYCNNSQGYVLGVLASGDGFRAGNECLCEVRDPNGYEGGVPEAEANAQLIAAAPELLAACQLLVAGWGHQDGVSAAVEAARAAIAKAS